MQRGVLGRRLAVALGAVVLVLAGCGSADPGAEVSKESAITSTSQVAEVSVEAPERVNPEYRVTPVEVERGTDIEVTSFVLATCGVVQIWRGTEWEPAGTVDGAPQGRDSRGEMVAVSLADRPHERACTDGNVQSLAPGVIRVPLDLEPGSYRLCANGGLGCSNNFEVLVGTGRAEEARTAERAQQDQPLYFVSVRAQPGDDIRLSGSVQTYACGQVQARTGSDWETVGGFSLPDEVAGRAVLVFKGAEDDEVLTCEDYSGPELTPSIMMVPLDAEPGTYRLCDHKLRCSNEFEILGVGSITPPTSAAPAVEAPERANPVYRVAPLVAQRGDDVDFTGNVTSYACGILQLWDGADWELVGGFGIPDEVTGRSVLDFGRDDPQFDEAFRCEDLALPPLVPSVMMVPLNAVPGIYRLCDNRLRCSNNFEIP